MAMSINGLQCGMYGVYINGLQCGMYGVKTKA